MMLAQKLRAAAEKSEWWAAVVRADLSMYRGPKLDEVGEFWAEGADPFGKKGRGWDRHGLTTFVER